MTKHQAATPSTPGRLWSERRWLRYAAAAATARLPGTMLPLGLVLAGQSVSGSFTAGSVIGSPTPWRRR